MTPKEVVANFYNSDIANNATIIDTYFHPDFKLHWHSSIGYNFLNFEAFKNTLAEIRKNYTNVRFQISHLLQENNQVVIRYTSYVTTIETPEEEQPLAYFTSIWEVEGTKIKQGFQMSNLADTKSESLKTFIK